MSEVKLPANCGVAFTRVSNLSLSMITIGHALKQLLPLRKTLRIDQCDQMTRLFVSDRAIKTNENLPNSKTTLPIYAQFFAKY